MTEYRTIMLSSTGAGANPSWTVPNNRTWTIESIRALCITSDTVGNRRVSVRMSDTNSMGNPLLEKLSGAVQAASTTRYYQFYVGATEMSAFGDTDWMEIPIPEIDVPAGGSIDVTDMFGRDGSSDTIQAWMVVRTRGSLDRS